MEVKILAVAEFDPAGVLDGHRAVLRERGYDYRLAVRRCYRSIQPDFVPDFVLGHDDDAAIGFLDSCDIVIFNPVIEQSWSHQSSDPVPSYLESGWPLVAAAAPRVRRLAYFHGSRNAWGNRAWYAEHYRGQGFVLAASTIDYAIEMPALYLPPLLDVPQGISTPRRAGEPLRIVHTPTDSKNCHTEEFLLAALRADCVPLFAARIPHEDVMRLKQSAHAGFDHLRGCWSVNTLENVALGLAPLVGVWERYLPALVDLGIAPPPFGLRHAADLGAALAELRDDRDLLEERRAAARRWFVQEASARALASRIADMLERM